MLIGYVRVSTNDQNTDLQRNALNCAGCELIFEDKISGTKSERPGLKKLLRTLSAGDTLVVWKLDRLGRSMRHLVILVEELRERGVNFRSLTDAIDASTPMGRFFFHVMGALAEMERELIVERTKALPHRRHQATKRDHYPTRGRPDRSRRHCFFHNNERTPRRCTASCGETQSGSKESHYHWREPHSHPHQPIPSE